MVWAASIMAILGLRALFGVVAESIGDTDALNKPVALILLFISGKICADFGGYQVSTKVGPGGATSALSECIAVQ